MLYASLIAAAVFASYLLLYTAYSKQSKTLEISLLVSVLTVGESVDKTLVELNKAISLAGLTALCMAFLPGLGSVKQDLMFVSMLMLWVHSGYSVFRFYNTTNIPPISDWPKMMGELKVTTHTRASPRAAWFFMWEFLEDVDRLTAKSACAQGDGTEMEAKNRLLGIKKVSIILGIGAFSRPARSAQLCSHSALFSLPPFSPVLSHLCSLPYLYSHSLCSLLSCLLPSALISTGWRSCLRGRHYIAARC